MASVVGKFFRTQLDGHRNCGDRAPLQFRDASASLRVNASGKPLHAERHLLALFSNPNLHCNVAAVSENFKRNPSIRVRRHPMQPAIADRTPQAGLVFAFDDTASWLGRDDAARQLQPAVPAS